MSFLEKLCLKLFSFIIGVLTILVLLILIDIVSISILSRFISIITYNDLSMRISVIVALIIILLSLKCLLFTSKKDEISKEGIILENESGKLVISKESLENMIASVAREIQGTESISSKTILDKERNLKVFVTIVVSRGIMLKQITSELQNKIKDEMKKTADLEVKEVNVRVKNITSKKLKNANNNAVSENSTKTEINNNIQEEATDEETK